MTYLIYQEMGEVFRVCDRSWKISDSIIIFPSPSDVTIECAQG
jgi:hypothetical protein